MPPGQLPDSYLIVIIGKTELIVQIYVALSVETPQSTCISRHLSLTNKARRVVLWHGLPRIGNLPDSGKPKKCYRDYTKFRSGVMRADVTVAIPWASVSEIKKPGRSILFKSQDRGGNSLAIGSGTLGSAPAHGCDCRLNRFDQAVRSAFVDEYSHAGTSVTSADRSW